MSSGLKPTAESSIGEKPSSKSRDGFVALLSGGLDSVVATAMAVASGSPLKLAATFDYGQRAFHQEKKWASVHAKKWGASHQVFDIRAFTQWGKSSLLSREKTAVPQGDRVKIDDPAVSTQTAEKVWVPNRNGLLMSWAAGLAESLGLKRVVVGFNKEEAQTFPDNSGDYLEAFNHSLKFSTGNQVQVESPTLSLNKTEIWQEAFRFGFGPNDFWSCYLDEETPCGRCESCQRSLAGYEKALKSVRSL